MLEWIENNGGLILSCVTVLFSAGWTIYTFLSKRRALKNAKTEEEKQAITNDIKASVFGLISSAEAVFSDVPKAGISKLLYVLNKVKELCGIKDIDYNAEFWTNFVNEMVEKANEVQDEKAMEDEKNAVIELIKKEIPTYIDNANALFRAIPDGTRYKLAYIVDAIRLSCENHHINVFGEYDWESYVATMIS